MVSVLERKQAGEIRRAGIKSWWWGWGSYLTTLMWGDLQKTKQGLLFLRSKCWNNFNTEMTHSESPLQIEILRAKYVLVPEEFSLLPEKKPNISLSNQPWVWNSFTNVTVLSHRWLPLCFSGVQTDSETGSTNMQNSVRNRAAPKCSLLTVFAYFTIYCCHLLF